MATTRKPRKYSLHIGLNSVDPQHYQGWDGALNACEADANDMLSLAMANGFDDSRIILTQDATTKAIADDFEIELNGSFLKAGDLLFLTYSGHGGQVPDTNFDEGRRGDRMDETWVLYDRQLIDDEIYKLLAGLKRGVRVLVLSDSCHSGTVVRRQIDSGNLPLTLQNGRIMKRRFLPNEKAEETYMAHKAMYDGIQKEVRAGEKRRVQASVVLISGCQDNQYSLDGQDNGLFTGTLLKVLRDGFQGSIRDFRDQIASRMPPYQTPNYFRIGRVDKEFEAKLPFTKI